MVAFAQVENSEQSIETLPRRQLILEDRPMDNLIVNEFTFDGFKTPLFTEVRGAALSLFVGMAHECRQSQSEYDDGMGADPVTAANAKLTNL